MLQPQLKLVLGSPANANLAGREVRELQQDYPVETNGLIVTVPLGFQSDGASIPKSCQWLVGHPFETDFRAAALVHDWLYYTHLARNMTRGKLVPITRENADDCLLDLLAQNGVGWIRRQSIYRAVRLAGGGHWDNDAEDKRYLARFAAQITESERDPTIYGLRSA
ncbi:TPA: hypothetical protein DDW35_11865 [Candidatus Sumerlaeota bacterium]|jgi:hypothetical protein|nr:hypothetical protein [Candidatus Sumerlaeota bacterium]